MEGRCQAQHYVERWGRKFPEFCRKQATRQTRDQTGQMHRFCEEHATMTIEAGAEEVLV